MMKFYTPLALGFALVCLPALIACGDDADGTPTPDANPPATDAAAPVGDAGEPASDANLPPGDASRPTPTECDPPAETDHLYSMSAETFATPSETRSMCDYRGEVLLIVNVAALCGFTPQYEALQNLQETYGADGLRILGFLTNDFRNQGGSKEEVEACSTMYGLTFEQFAQVGVIPSSEDGQHPIFAWLTSQEGMEGDIAWNFNKFLVSRDGELLGRWDQFVAPDADALVSALTAALGE